MFDSVRKTNCLRGSAAAALIVKRLQPPRGARLASFAGGLALIALIAAPGQGSYEHGRRIAADHSAEGILFSYRTADARRIGHDVEDLTSAVLRGSFAATATAERPRPPLRRASFARMATLRLGRGFEGFEVRFADWPSVGENVSGAEDAFDTADLAENEILCLAQNIYFEARGETRVGKLAVGQVVMNRVASKKFPDSICGVVRQGGEQARFKCQFSWWCDGKSDRPRNRQSWTTAQLIAATLLTKPPPDPTHGALFFHHSAANPVWFRTRTPTAEIGRHIFYR